MKDKKTKRPEEAHRLPENINLYFGHQFRTEFYKFVKWVSMRYFYTSPEGWLADFDTSDEPKYITTAELYERWKNRDNSNN